MKLGIRARLFVTALGLMTLCVTAVYAYGSAQLRGVLRSQFEEDLGVRAELVAERASNFEAPMEKLAAWDSLADRLGERAGARVTLIRDDGRVIGDSQVPLAELPRLDNHGSRPEVVAALRSGTGAARRRSVTVEERMLYVAVPFGDEAARGVARVALPNTDFNAVMRSFGDVLTVATMLALALAVVLASVAAHLSSRTARSLTATARRMAAGDLDARCYMSGHDEFAELGRALDRLAAGLSRTLEQLRNERDLQSSIFTGMREGVLHLDGQLRIALMNPALREMLGVRTDPVDRSLLETVRHAKLKELVDAVCASGESASSEIEVSGMRPRILSVRAARLDGETAGVLAVFVDVTEMRRLETMRRDFVANVSHELRTPIAAIRSSAETLRGAGRDDPKAAERFLPVIERHAGRLQGLVEDLLDLSRIESREWNLNPEPVDVAECGRHVVDLSGSRAEAQKIVLRCNIPNSLPRVRADERALEQVLLNLIDNAIKYCHAGSQVELSAEERADGIAILVIDDGPGIEAKHLPRLFERFYRVDPGRSREMGGTGLGLSIVKHLVEAMGGSVEVHSVLGEGTTFTIRLVSAPTSGAFEIPERAAS